MELYQYAIDMPEFLHSLIVMFAIATIDFTVVCQMLNFSWHHAKKVAYQIVLGKCDFLTPISNSQVRPG